MKTKHVLLPVMIGMSFGAWAKSKPVFLTSIPDVEISTKFQGPIRGMVKTATGEPILGASIFNLATGKTTQTDQHGDFVIEGKIGHILRLSMIGFETQQVKVEATTLAIQLVSTDQSLDEVIVVGYGKQKKVNLTGAVTQIDAKILENRPVANATQALQGAIPNLNITFTNGRPGGEGNVNIRGFASINSANAQPLILIDGVPGNINTINPRDIESISV